ncbi:MAG: hypothetical protein RBT59_00335 [Arcobacteraceae bacterium]|jgi:hypothetical protein|nr:hypothetical protein [Arcobacteraceae bacterium]
MKEFKFVSTVQIADDVESKYPNYHINGFTPKKLAKRLISGNSDKKSKENFGFEYKTTSIKPLKTLFVVQEIGAVDNTIQNINMTLDKKTAEDFILSHQKSSQTVLVVNELDLSSMELYCDMKTRTK